MPVSIRLPKKLRDRLLNVGRGVVTPPLSMLILKAIEEFVDRHERASAERKRSQ